MAPVEDDPFAGQAGAFGVASPGELANVQPNILNKIFGGLVNSLVTLPKRAVDASANRLMGGDYDPGPVLEAAMLPMGTGAIAGVPMRAGEAVLGAGPIRAYHGSPHDFDKFSMSKIGTGEGAQAYGHGLYFAESEGVARSYRDALQQFSINGKAADGMDPSHIAAVTLKNYGGNKAKAIDDLQMVATRGPEAERGAASEALDMLRSDATLPKVSGGKMYEVQIKADPDHFLDWDKALKDQPKAIQDLYNAKIVGGLKTRELGVNPNLGPLTDVIHPDGGSLGVFTKEQLPDVLANPAKYVPARGENFYRSLHEDAIRGGKPEPAKVKELQVVDQLRNAGIPGIKYLDQGSRGVPTVGNGRVAGRGDGKFDIVDDFGVQAGPFDTKAEAMQYLNPEKNMTRNFVVFDDKLVDIIKKYGIAGLSMMPPATAAFLSNRIKPVEHDPFGPALVAVDHDPFAEKL